LLSTGFGKRSERQTKEALVSTLFGVLTLLVLAFVPAYLIGMLLISIRNERRRENIRRIWANFALSIVLCILFLVSWVGQAIAEWRVFVDEQREHGEPATAGEFFVQFGQSTLENWQSEFLQLFSFVVLAAAYIHHGSAESRDGTDRIEELLRKVANKVGAT
jgi:4-amino-4-deoxy-L-arabinose transferase-like glycosyltransferase